MNQKRGDLSHLVANITKAQIDTLGKTCDRMVAHALYHTRKHELQASDIWIEIVEPRLGYSEVHTLTRGSPKAPPLPRELWRNWVCYGRPHELAQIYLQDWGCIWTLRMMGSP